MKITLLTVAAMSSILALAACSKKPESTETKVEKVENKVKDALDARPNEKLKDAAEDAKDAIKDAAKKTGEAAEAAAQKVEETAKKAANEVESK